MYCQYYGTIMARNSLRPFCAVLTGETGIMVGGGNGILKRIAQGDKVRSVSCP